MKSAALIIAALFLISPLLYSDDWSAFQHDPLHRGNSSVDFISKDLAPLWVFRPTERTWSYKRGSSVWSSSAAIAHVNGRDIVFAGFYNNNLYAVDALTGDVIWRFITGGRTDYAPCIATVNGRAMAYIACADRTIYAVDALTGEKVWSYETLPWSYTVSESVASSPVIVLLDGRSVLICAVWNSGNAPFNRFQTGDIFALDAATGKKIYSRAVSATPLNSPAFAAINGEPMIFISSRDGTVACLSARNAGEAWKLTSCGFMLSSPSVCESGGVTRLFVGSRFGNLYCLDASTGKILWTNKVGHAVDATPATADIDGRTIVYAGAYDRNIYAFDAVTGKKKWSFKTGDYVASSCAVARMGEGTAIFVQSLDNTIYCLDGSSGALLWKYALGRLIWKYNTRGDTIWSSPAVSTAGGRPLLVFPCYDGKLYAFTVKDK